MKKIKVRIKKMPTMKKGGYFPMYQNGSDTTLPSIEDPEYFRKPAPQPATAPVVVTDTGRIVPAPVMDSLAVAAPDTSAFASDSGVVKKTPKGKIQVAQPAKAPTPDASGYNNWQTWGAAGLGAGALGYNFFKNRNFVPPLPPNPNAWVVPTTYQSGRLALPAADKPVKQILADITKRKGYLVDEIRALKRQGYTQEQLAQIMAAHPKVENVVKPVVQAAKPAAKPAAKEAATAVEEVVEAVAPKVEGFWDAVKNGYKAFRATRAAKVLKKGMGGYPDMYQLGGDPDSTFENVVEFLDPTGMSSYDDVYRTFQDPEAAWWEKGLTVAGALPIVGKVGKAAKAAGELSKFRKAMNVAGKVITPVAQMDRYVNPVSKLVANTTGKAVQNAPKAAKWLADFGSVSNQNARFFNGMDMLMGVPGHEYGGEPMMAYGGQMGWGLDLNSRRNYSEPRANTTDSVGRTLEPVHPDDATYEAERNEVIVGDMDKDGGNEMMVFGGKRHSQGGTPANQEGFIFSDTKGLKLKGPIVEQFGRTPNKKGFTPAELAKQYNINKYKAVIEDPNADSLSKRTAEMMKENYERKLAKLAMVQESMKGFPQGVPAIAQEFMGEQEEMRWGGIPKMQDAGATPAWLTPWMKSNTVAGRTSKKNSKSTLYDPATGNTLKEDYGYWRQHAGRDFKDLGDMSSYVFNTLREKNPAAVQAIIDEYGYPNAHTLADPKYLGVRSAKAFASRIPTATTQTTTPVAATNTQVVPTDPFEGYNFQEGEEPEYVTSSAERLPYNRIDVANIMGAIASPVKMYGPRMFTPNLQQVRGVYDQADYNPLLAAANTRAQMNNTFGNIGAAMAANTYNPELMQGLIQETARARGNNLQMANQIAGQNNQIRNQQEILNAQAMADNYDKWIKTQEEGDIAEKLKWRKDVMPAIQQAEKNRINMERFNAENPQYDVTGNDWRINFTKGKQYGDKPSAGGTLSFERYLAGNPQLKSLYEKSSTTDEAKLKIYQMYQTYLNQRMQMYGKNPKNLYGNMYNPALPGLWGGKDE